MRLIDLIRDSRDFSLHENDPVRFTIHLVNTA